MEGAFLAKQVREEVRSKVEELRDKGVGTCLATVLIGTDEQSAKYVGMKQAACADIGIATKDIKRAGISQDELNGIVAELNRDRRVNGVLIQLPLPSNLDRFATISALKPDKDVDGLTATNLGLLMTGRAGFIPCTPYGIQRLLQYYHVDTKGKEAVIVNRSTLVGIPLAFLLQSAGATVTICHSETEKIEPHIGRADILVTAVPPGGSFMVTGSMIKEGATVIDAAGNVDYESVIRRAAYVTPSKGGVGPMTVAMLLKNTATAAARQAGLPE
ncbi:MAG: bifunctional 5,10-methylenetetrahydrofolate dehydrogenase/5,10-methenyltetrahydrofolate cyclohydrolase [Candidatus Micrarchaeota archaeon]|nr:bifunctional 5,10-methylenetetrahydrofolate dehydrogenase/5,10-methenyltetrahydrofolate cyclohydrolase [Candidatus Micrarchaeota archaeon]